jgi:hypothetical protein
MPKKESICIEPLELTLEEEIANLIAVSTDSVNKDYIHKYTFVGSLICILNRHNQAFDGFKFNQICFENLNTAVEKYDHNRSLLSRVQANDTDSIKDWESRAQAGEVMRIT